MRSFFGFVVLACFLTFNAVSCFPKRDLNEMPQSDPNEIDPYNMPESCTKKYCTIKDDEYPQKDVNKLVTKISKHEDKKLSYNDTTIKSIEHSEFSDVPLDCVADHRTVPIYYIKDENDKTRVVVQSGSGLFNQTFEIRECPQEGPVLKSKIFLSTSRIQVSCKTTYLLFDFYVLSHGNNIEMEVIQAELPVCCKCEYTKAW